MVPEQFELVGEQGTPVKLRDGPAAVTDVIGRFSASHRFRHSTAIASPDARRRTKWKHRESEDLPATDTMGSSWVRSVSRT